MSNIGVSNEDSSNNLEKQQTSSSSFDEHSVHEYTGFGAHDVHQLAKTLTNEDTSSAASLKRYLTHMSQVPGVNPLEEEEEDERLNPNSDNFDSKFWVKNMKSWWTRIQTTINPRNWVLVTET